MNVYSSNQSSSCDARLPIVVVGSGPVGIRFVQAVRKRDQTIPIILYGKEPWEPYNRVKLSSLLSGDIKLSDINTPFLEQEQSGLVTRLNCAIEKIDTIGKYVVDSYGGRQPYSKLVLALGSTPHIPNIQGIKQNGVYTLRNLNDVQQLMARQTRARKVVVIGGGLLGLEAAKAMQRNNTEVTIIEHTQRLLSSQLDNEASELLREYILSIGIHVRLGEPVKEIIRDKYGLSAVKIGTDTLIQCDTIIVSTGIKPNIGIAREAKVSVGVGIRVDDSMCTSNPDIYAIGECCEHRNKIYGLVAPGYEQAEVAAHSLLKGSSKYEGSDVATNLKVIEKPMFSMGDVAFDEYRPSLKEYKYSNYSKGIYRKLVVKNKRLVGALSVGEWREQGRIQSLVNSKKIIMPWWLLRFKKTGCLYSNNESVSVSGWPSNTIVCNCTGRTRGDLSKAITNGCHSIENLKAETGASSVCGSCKPLLQSLLGSNENIAPVKLFKTIGAVSVFVLMLFATFSVTGTIQYNTHAEYAIQWDVLWRSGLAKQISGFTILGLSALAVVLSLRKRINKVVFGDYDIWRAFHVLVSLLVVISLITHTGFRMGSNLNYYLMLTFLAMLLIGTFSAITISIAHKFDAVTIGKVRRNLVWSHIILFWPVPILLTFHVLKSYYF